MAEVRSPALLLAQFDGTNLQDKLALSAILATVGEDGWPHLAYLSAGEILAVASDRVRIRLWPTSGTADNLRRAGRSVLHVPFEGAVGELRLETADTIDANEYLIVDMTITSAISHRAPYATVLGMIRFALKDEAATLARWQAQITHMRSIDEGAPASGPRASLGEAS